MSRLERLTLTLPSELADAIKAAVDAGGYASPSEAAEEAFGAWVSQRQLEQGELDTLRAAYAEGKASGSLRELDIEHLIGRARTRLSAAERD
jgi:antitoxin ParD1/3/4